MDRRQILLHAITEEAFAPFGTLLDFPGTGERVDASRHLTNLRRQAEVQFSITNRISTELPFLNRTMERHRWSAQMFVPIDVSRYIVAVAPCAADGGPDLANLRGFSVSGDQGIVYRPDVWHCPMTVLDHNARYAVLLWRDGTADDEEFVELPEWLEFVRPD